MQNEGYDIIPAMIIQALAGKKVTLILNGWDYEQIVLYGEYITAEKERTYYDYEMLKLLEESSAYKIEEEMTDKSYDKTDEERIAEEEHNKKIMTILQKAEQKRQRKQFVRYAAITIFAFSAIVPIVQVYLKRIRKKRLTDENNADWRKI